MYQNLDPGFVDVVRSSTLIVDAHHGFEKSENIGLRDEEPTSWP